ncbi:tetratricopeptide repeat protein [Ensifer adhaerens]|uniref:tetratricopeptide repeat protein n=1 Tax=Ensifer adhaerens TaxID=106592 RepID=UPI000DE16183|nr:tetratricopeptide repeat protein [Ensifer adhaerens]MBW0365456.1 tetratricopeptide repeat protein [Ensifer adhaerens]UCM22790.1 tetratricopeptide repeat protein [Ensifer adhaerens]
MGFIDGSAKRRQQSNAKANFVRQGDIARDEGNWRAAALAYRAALEEQPDRGPIWVQLGHAEKESGNLSLAVLCYRKGVQLMPSDADAYLQLGMALKLQGQFVEAATMINRTIELDRSHAGARGLLSELFNRIAEVDPNSSDVPGGAEIIQTARFFEVIQSLRDYGSEGYYVFSETAFSAKLLG